MRTAVRRAEQNSVGRFASRIGSVFGVVLPDSPTSVLQWQSNLSLSARPPVLPIFGAAYIARADVERAGSVEYSIFIATRSGKFSAAAVGHFVAPRERRCFISPALPPDGSYVRCIVSRAEAGLVWISSVCPF